MIKRCLIIAAVLLGTEVIVKAEAVQPIVNTSQVVYGSAQKLITSNSDVTIDTTTHKMTAGKGLSVSTLTFTKDGTFITSTTGFVATAAWGSITGTLSNQTDLNNVLTALAASTTTAATTLTTHGNLLNLLAVSTTSLAVSTTSLQSSITALNASTNSIATVLASLAVSTTAHQSALNLVAVSTTALSVSTASIQTQINNLALTYLTLSSATATYLATATAANVYLSTINAASTYLTQSSATATYLQLSSATATYQQQAAFANTTSSGVLTSTDWNSFNSRGFGTVTNVTAGPGLSGGGTGPTVTIQVSSVSLSTQTFGNLPVTNLNGGLNAMATTYWSGGGTWVAISTNIIAGAAAIAVGSGTASNFTNNVTSPTQVFSFLGSQFSPTTSGTTSFIALNQSSVTVQGNIFNNANQLVQLTSGSQYPGNNGNLITNLAGANVTGILPVSTLPSGSTLYIQAQNTSVQQSTFNVLSGNATFLNVTSSATVISTMTAGYFIGNGGGITNLPNASLPSNSTFYLQNNSQSVIQSAWGAVSTMTTVAAGSFVSPSGGLNSDYNGIVLSGNSSVVQYFGSGFSPSFSNRWGIFVNDITDSNSGVVSLGGVVDSAGNTVLQYKTDATALGGSFVQPQALQILNYVDFSSSITTVSHTVPENGYVYMASAAVAGLTITLPDIDAWGGSSNAGLRGGRFARVCKLDSSTNTISFAATTPGANANPVTPLPNPLTYQGECQDFQATYVFSSVHFSPKSYWQPVGRLLGTQAPIFQSTVQFNASTIYLATTTNVLSSNQNDFNFGNFSVVRSSAINAINITGFTGGVDGREFEFINVGTTTITLQNQNTGSAAADRIITLGGSGDESIASNQATRVWYDAVTQRWRLLN